MPHLTETTKMELFLLPILAAGHLTSTMEMASRLLDRVGGGGLSVTVLVMTTPAPCLRFETESCIPSLSSIGAGVRFEELPVLPPAQFFEECDQVGASCSRYVELHKPRLKTAILRLRSSPAAALVIDFFATTMIDVADELAVGERPMSGSRFLYHGRRFPETKCMILNTFFELEPSTLEALVDGVYEPHDCIKWLDEQPPASVVFLYFGSISAFSREQLKEMATGLESSGHRFLWSLRGTGDDLSLQEVLPEGFMERTEGQGLVWRSWAPQVEILSHAAVGGLVTHCGWNSCLGSLWHGVPMLEWPIHAEQHYLAFRLAREAGVALELTVDRTSSGNLVAGAELKRGVRSLMEEDTEEGKQVRRRAQEMKASCRRAVEEGGSSYTSLESLVNDLLNH
ncbi:unnamed protein product [Musa hybrid cultivar]